MPMRAVVFDVGGVLEVTPDLGVFTRWEARLQLPAGAIDERLADVWAAGTVGTMTEPEIHHALGERLRIPPGVVAEMMAEVWQEYLGTANTELIDYARVLRRRYRTGILSNSFVGAREREEAAYGLVNMVDVVIYSHEVGLTKPDPRIYALTCHRLGVEPAETLFLDDVERHVAAAREAGLLGIHYQDNAQARSEIEAILGAN